MRIEILNIYPDKSNYFVFRINIFSIWFINEKYYWTDERECSIGIRFGNKIYEKRWGNAKQI